MRAAAPMLVTGIPRSGNTWLARLLATAPGTALIGREPMNTRTPRQYALAGTVEGWVEVIEPTPRQRRALQAAYTGRVPSLFGRYGVRQWAAPLPSTRRILKDPFAVLSLPAITAVTGARPVLIFRHPAAVLASYRRMGWGPDTNEVRALVSAHRARALSGPATRPAGSTRRLSDAEEFGEFWAALYEIALDNAPRTPGLTVVSHEALAGGGAAAVRALFETLGLRAGERTHAELQREARVSEPATSVRLHNFDRAPDAVASGWRASVSAADVDAVESVAGEVLAKLEEMQLRDGGT